MDRVTAPGVNHHTDDHSTITWTVVTAGSKNWRVSCPHHLALLGHTLLNTTVDPRSESAFHVKVHGTEVDSPGFNFATLL